jgi:hypothetical protein
VVIVGSKPNGLPVIFCPEGWRWLRRYIDQFKFDGLTAGRGGIAAYASHCKCRPLVARLLTNAKQHETVLYRDGNFFDLRLANLVSAPRQMVKAAKRPAPPKPDNSSPFVTLRDGRVRARRKPSPSAQERLQALLAQPE